MPFPLLRKLRTRTGQDQRSSSDDPSADGQQTARHQNPLSLPNSVHFHTAHNPLCCSPHSTSALHVHHTCGSISTSLSLRILPHPLHHDFHSMPVPLFLATLIVAPHDISLACLKRSHHSRLAVPRRPLALLGS